jgi:SagB-type dehydrogenase family enzyme
MRTISLLFTVAATACIVGFIPFLLYAAAAKPTETIKLPEPAHAGGASVEQALSQRRSVREYRNGSLNLSEVSQLLWAAQGVTSAEGTRTAPSAGALYPLEVYIAAGNVDGLRPGIYKYRPGDHSLVKTADGDKRDELSQAATGQPSVRAGAIVIVISGVYERTTGKYREPIRDERTGSGFPGGVKYVHMEAGHASQNVCLQAESLGLGTVTIGALSDDDVRRIIGMPGEERPLYLMPVGKR